MNLPTPEVDINDFIVNHPGSKTVVDKTFETITEHTCEHNHDTDSDVLNPTFTGETREIHDADVDEIDDYQSDPNATHILVMPNGEELKGTSDMATLWDWHHIAGCINPQYLLRVAPHCKGMEHVTKIKSPKIPGCEAMHSRQVATTFTEQETGIP